MPFCKMILVLLKNDPNQGFANLADDSHVLNFDSTLLSNVDSLMPPNFDSDEVLPDLESAYALPFQREVPGGTISS